jgi:hypothetical protein
MEKKKMQSYLMYIGGISLKSHEVKKLPVVKSRYPPRNERGNLLKRSRNALLDD